MKETTFNNFMGFIKINRIVPDFLSESKTWQTNVKVILSSLERFTQSEIGKEYISDLQNKKNITVIKGVTLSEGSCKECNSR